MGLIIVGLVIGFAAGIAAAYALLQKRLIEQQKASEEKTRQIVERLEKDREIQLRQTLETLQKDHQAQLAVKNQEIAALKASSTDTVDIAQPETPAPQEISDPWQEETIQTETKVQPDVTETPAAEPREDHSSESVAPVDSVEAAATTIVQSVVEETATSGMTATRDHLLLEQIQIWGKSKQTSRIPSLIDSIYHPNAEVRQAVAIALGQICGNQRMSVEIQRVIPTLAKLSRDPQTGVRQAAVKALGNIRSEKVLPHLRLALRDCNGQVVRIASTALRKLNLSPQTEEIYRRRQQTINS